MYWYPRDNTKEDAWVRPMPQHKYVINIKNNPIQIEAVFSIIIEGRSNTHLIGLKPCHIIKVVQTVIIIYPLFIGNTAVKAQAELYQKIQNLN